MQSNFVLENDLELLVLRKAFENNVSPNAQLCNMLREYLGTDEKSLINNKLKVFVDYMIDNKTCTKSDLRNLKVVNNQVFKEFLEKNHNDICSMIDKRGFLLNIKKGDGNMQFFVVTKKVGK